MGESSATVLIWCKTSLASVQDHSRVCSSPELICYYIPFFSMRVFTQVMLLHCSVVKMLEVKSFSLPVYYIPNQTEGKPQTDQTSILHLPPKQPRPPPLNPKLHNLHPPPRRLLLSNPPTPPDNLLPRNHVLPRPLRLRPPSLKNHTLLLHLLLSPDQ